MIKKRIKLLLKLLVTLGFVGWVIWDTDWTEVLSHIREISWWQIVLYLLVVTLGMAISAYKWKMLANFKNLKLSWWAAFKLYFTGTFINNFMPSFIGGDTYRAYEIGKEEKRYAQAASTVMMDRITGLLGAIILALAFSLINISSVIESKTLVIINILIFLSLVLDIFLAKIKHIRWFREKMKNILPEKIAQFLWELDSYNHNSKILYQSISWGAVFSLVGVAASNYILFISLGVNIGVLDYLSVIFLISIISSLPISINNIGLKEWAYVTLFGFFGLNSSAVMGVAILSRLLLMLLSFFALPLYLENKIEGRKKLEQMEEKI